MLFGKSCEEKVEILERVKLEDGITRTVSRVGKFTITTTSNKPSAEAIQRAGEICNRIAEEHVDKQNAQIVA